MDILNKFAIFLLQGIVYVPLYAVLFSHFLKYVNVQEKVWQRSFVLAIVTYSLFTVLSLAFGLFTAAWIGYVIGALMIAYVLTKLVVVPYRNAVLASVCIAVIGYDVPRVVFGFINQSLAALI
ncbi:MAG: hypothetical protein OEY52_15105 [Gammaproteobacteria bacterium]|nr:hypothetical protein [Gammaproteobacteria bacterium]